MKFHASQPQKEMVVYKPDTNDQFFEVYVLRPYYVGSVRRIAPSVVQSEDGETFKNVNMAARAMLEKFNETDLASQLSERMMPRGRKRAGMDLVEQDLWTKFCKMRGLNPRDVQAMQAEYDISPDEWDALTGKAKNAQLHGLPSNSDVE